MLGSAGDRNVRLDRTDHLVEDVVSIRPLVETVLCARHDDNEWLDPAGGEQAIHGIGDPDRVHPIGGWLSEAMEQNQHWMAIGRSRVRDLWRRVDDDRKRTAECACVDVEHVDSSCPDARLRIRQ